MELDHATLRTHDLEGTRAFFEALRRGLLNNDELEKAAVDLEGWLERDQKKFLEEQKKEAKKR